jgi:3-phenylpropionate/trans-cinnamate dioxygenase ferredoxin reductase subunit
MREVPWFWTQQFDMMIQMVGWADAGLEWVLRGETATGAFAAYALADGAVQAVHAVNRGADYALGRRLVRERIRAEPGQLADPAFDPKTLLPARRGR